MFTRHAVAVACLALLATPAVVLAGRAPAPRPSMTFSTPVVSAAPVVLGDGAGPYVDGSSGVAVTLQTSGNIQLDTRSSSSRGLWLDFGSHLDVSGNAFPGDKRIVRVLMTSHCHSTPGAVLLNQMTAIGQETQCSMTLRYDDDPATASTYYRLGFNTDLRDTEYVKFRCDAVTGGKCTAWTATPADNNNGEGNLDQRSYAAVIPVTESKQAGAVEGAWLGVVPFSFQFSFTK